MTVEKNKSREVKAKGEKLPPCSDTYVASPRSEIKSSPIFNDKLLHWMQLSPSFFVSGNVRQTGSCEDFLGLGLPERMQARALVYSQQK